MGNKLGHHNEKRARNEEIRELWSKGGLTQEQIGRRYGLTQTRINAIIYRRVPSFHYCTYPILESWNRKCNQRVSWGAHCDFHRALRAAERIVKVEMREKAIAERKKRRQERQNARIREKEAKHGRKYLLKVLFFLQRSLRSQRYEETRRIFQWQYYGREHVRYMVRARDRHTCQDCGDVRTPEEVAEHNRQWPRMRKSFDVHHIYGLCGKKSRGYDKVSEMHLLVTLCHSCHFRRHDFSKKGKDAQQKLGAFQKLKAEAKSQGEARSHEKQAA